MRGGETRLPRRRGISDHEGGGNTRPKKNQGARETETTRIQSKKKIGISGDKQRKVCQQQRLTEKWEINP